MDESDHLERLEASITSPNVSEHPGGTQSPSGAAPSPNDSRDSQHSGTKRPMEDDESGTNQEKRQHVESDDDEELDLDALMAHIQQHTEQGQANATESPSESSLEKNASNEDTNRNGDPQNETELSIAAQLRGALSSLQDLDDDGSDEINIDELSQILKPAEDITSKRTPDSPNEDRAPPRASDENNRSTQDSRQAASSEATPDDSAHTDPKANPARRENKHEALMLRMPPPPAHLGGNLPPMPPPPAAFTSPVASYTAIELSKSSGRTSTIPPNTTNSALPGAGPSRQVRFGGATVPLGYTPRSATPSAGSLDGKNVADMTSKFPEPSFSEVSSVSDKYGSALAAQIDTVFMEKSNERSEPSGKDVDVSESADVGGTAPTTGITDSSGQTQAPTLAVLHLNENKAILQARKRSILLLDSLACQVLDTLSFSHYQDTLSTVMQPESDRGMAYRILLDAFEDLKRIYLKWETRSSREQAEPKIDEIRPFLSYDIPGIETSRDNLITIQRVNLATFVAAIFGSIEIGFHELNDWFIKVFVPENGRLLKQQGNIYLDLKTQAYISALESTDNLESRQAALDHLFPTNLELQMQEMFGDRVSLAPTEKDFVAKCHRRKENIKSENEKDLPMKYHWVPFLRDVSEYISRNHYTLLPQRKHSIVPSEVVGEHSAMPTPTVRNYPGTRRQAPTPSSRAGSVSVEAERESAPGLSGHGNANASNKGPESSQNNSSRTSPSVPRTGESPNQSVDNNTATSSAEVEVSSVTPATSSIRANHPERSKLKMELDEIFSDNNNKPDNKKDKNQTKNSTQHDGTAWERSGVTSRNMDGAAKGAADTESSGLPPIAGSSKPPAGEIPHPPAHKHPSIPLEGHPLFPPLPKQVLPRPSYTNSSAPSDSSDKERSRRPGPRPQAEAVAQASAGSSNTLAVYEAARASAEGTDLVRPKVSLYTTRRTWTKEEEEALLKGMDRVQGPYWAQILELYGPGGKINEVLKDRTQVQLKDKARNLKMFFVRLGLPIPAVFQYVTGDYETRKSSSKRVRDKKQLKTSPMANAPVMVPVHQEGAQMRMQHVHNSMETNTIQTTQLGNASLQPPAALNTVRPLADPEASQAQHQQRTNNLSHDPQLSSGNTPTTPVNNPVSVNPKRSSQHSLTQSSANLEHSSQNPVQNQGNNDATTTKPAASSSKISETNLDTGAKSNYEHSESSETHTNDNRNDEGERDEAKEAEEDLSSLLDRVGEYVDSH